MERHTYKPLANGSISAAGCYVAEALNPGTVKATSPAIDVMTDLSRIPAATISADDQLHEANQSMILRGVRLLLVVGNDQKVVGVVTSADILGERPVQVAQNRGLKRGDLRVHDVMTAVDSMDVLRLEDVVKAEVGHIVATLKSAGRAHALVVATEADGRQVLRGIFSASQIARQLGVQIATHEMARTFAEIEALIAGV